MRLTCCNIEQVSLSRLERAAYHRRLARTDTATAIIAPPDYRLSPALARPRSRPLPALVESGPPAPPAQDLEAANPVTPRRSM